MDLRTLHSDAMDLAEKAMIERARGNHTTAIKHLRKAFHKEEMAARKAVETGVPEPALSILLKSAAHLAVDVGELRHAEKLVASALAGDPPNELAHELRGLLEEVGFHRHLDLQGVELQSNDVQMVLVGAAVAPGMAASDEFVGRVKTFQSLIYRTSESDEGIDYRERGDPKQEIERPLQLFVSMPRAASFAVSLKIASAKGQGEFSFAKSSVVLDKLLDRLGMFDRGEFESLKHELPKKGYYENFVKLASDLAPDGDRVRMVGFTSQRGQHERRIEMRRAPEAGSGDTHALPTRDRRSFTGRLFYYNENNEGSLTVKIRTEDGAEYRLRSETDLLTKATKYVGRSGLVVITGVQTGRTTIEFDGIKAQRRKRTPKKAPKKHR